MPGRVVVIGSSNTDLIVKAGRLPGPGETASLTGLDPAAADFASKAARTLLDRGVTNVIVTLGEQGAYALGRNYEERLPPFPAKAVDATAAGDVFNGALAAALAEGRDLGEAVRFGQAAASISVTRLGAQPSIPHREEIEAKIKEKIS